MSPLPADPLEPLSTRKEAARQFLQLVGAGSIDEAYQRYVAMDGKHHNPYFAAGFPALQAAMKANFIQFPDMHLTIKNVVGEGDLVAIHSQVVMQPGEPGFAAVHLFRFQGDRIVEMWDVAQQLPPDLINLDGAF